jgi:RimJ/RimL family protein N-acetyltransferase
MTICASMTGKQGAAAVRSVLRYRRAMQPAGDSSAITTERLVLRRFRSADAHALHAIFSDREAMRFWSTAPHATLAETEQFVRRTMAAQDAGTADEFVVARDGAIIGKAGLWRANEIGFIFVPLVWGRGFASEALSAIMARAARRGFVVLRADVDPRNARSLRLLQRLGFRTVGSATRTLQIGAEWVDSVYLEATLARPAASI